MQPSPPRLLLIEDGVRLCRLVKDYLETMEYSLDMAHTGPSALALALAGKFHAVLLDLALVVQRAIAREAFSGVRIETHVPPELALWRTRRLVRALFNVLRYTIRCAGSAGPITIGARRKGPAVALTAADCGPGLAIVKSCVELCPWHGEVPQPATVEPGSHHPSGCRVAK
jgi:CheY-like chemotaxis protein